MKKKGRQRKESRTEQAADRGGMIKDKKAFVKRLNVRRQ